MKSQQKIYRTIYGNSIENYWEINLTSIQNLWKINRKSSDHHSKINARKKGKKEEREKGSKQEKKETRKNDRKKALKAKKTAEAMRNSQESRCAAEIGTRKRKMKKCHPRFMR